MQLRFAPIALIGLSATTFAQGIDVALVAAATSDITNCRFTDPQAFLMATGMFNSVDVFNAQAAAPTLADLMPYDAVLTWSNFPYADPAATGDAFADYVDAGGGVVVAMFGLGAGAGGATPLQLQGRWAPGYEVIDPLSGQTSGAATLGTVLAPAHPVMAGVASLDGGTASYRPRMSNLQSGAQPIAEWSDGTILVAESALLKRVDVTLYPPSSQCRSDFWDITTDGATLLANALVYTATGGSPGTNYCGPAVPNSTGNSATISAAGSTTVTDNNLTLVASALPQNAFGFFLTSRTQGLVMQAGGSQGTLCLGGSIGRFVGPGQIQNSGTAGEMSLMLDLTQQPTPTGLVAVLANETWNFQAWYRDSVGGSATSNFTDGLEVAFQ